MSKNYFCEIVYNAYFDQHFTPVSPSKLQSKKTVPYRLERKHKEKEEQVAYKLEQEIALWDPNSRENSTQDPFKTLFVARINYDTSQSKLR